MLLVSGTPAAMKIENAIAAQAVPQGARFERNVLLDLGPHTEDYSYVLVDRHGLLVIHVETWPGAAIHGNSRETRWAARVKGGRTQRFSNPVKDGARRIQNLKQALEVFGKRLPDDYFQDLVVIYDADISNLSPDVTASMRVINGFDVQSALQSRYDFAVNPGALTKEEVEELAGLLHTVNRSDDPAAQAKCENAQTQRAGVLPAFGRTGVEVGVADGAVGIAPIAPRVADRYPTMKPARTRTASMLALALALVAAFAVWCFMYGGLETLQANVAQLLGSGGSTGAEQQDVRPTAPVGADVDQAKRLLQEAAPDIHAKVTDLDHPEIAHVEEYTTYTWHYPDTRAPGGAGWIALTIDQAGQLRGVTGS